jgi:EAL domain-containing protein (putative c-di-GMP-specific phosphodiesterase class I)/CheY-like chemotaxis protein
MRTWLDANLPPVKVAINLAARHFLSPELLSDVRNALGENSLEPRWLEIEITEGAMMSDIDTARSAIHQLKELGVSISLDDFGTGYSSLSYLSRFPVDVVKIDKAFVTDISTNPANAAIAQATIAMAHKLGMIALAEGVETEEQMRFLRRNDCDEIQGFYFSRPQPADDIARLLREGRSLDVGHVGHERDTVLLVDDDVSILNSLKRILRNEGYDLLVARSALEGLSILAKQAVQVVITDQRMPEMTGTEFLSRVRLLHPETIRIVLSGHSDISTVTDSINKGAAYRFLLKPWDNELLKSEILIALRYWRERYGSDKD